MTGLGLSGEFDSNGYQKLIYCLAVENAKYVGVCHLKDLAPHSIVCFFFAVGR